MANRRRRTKLILAVLAAVVLLGAAWALLADLAVGRAKDQIDVAVDHVHAAAPGSGGLLRLVSSYTDQNAPADEASAVETSREELRRAAAAFEQAGEQLGSPVLAPARFLPVIGRQLSAAETMTTAAAEVTEASASAIDQLMQIAEQGDSSPASRVSAVDETTQVLTDLEQTLTATDLGPTSGLTDEVREGRDRFQRELDELAATVGSARVVAVGVSEFLTGPTSYLVLAANNAEMRAGSGMALQIGTVGILGGTFALSEFTPTEQLLLDAPGSELDPDVAAHWSALLPNQEWRNLNLTPRFDDSARMASEMWVAAGNDAVQGVMQLDVAAVRQLLELTGPVTIDESTVIDSDNVAKMLLREQYASFEDRTERRDQLGRVTAAVFDAFNHSSISGIDLLAFIERAGAQRHLLMWSSQPAQEAAWSELGVSGTIDDASLMVSLINRGGTKLDPYVKLHSELSTHLDGDTRRVTVTTTITNEAPEGLPSYVEGPVDGSGGQAGEYVGILAVTAPGAASDPSTSAGGFAALGADGPSQLIASNVAVQRGQQVQVVTSFDLPADLTSIKVLPSTHLPRATWTAGDKEWAEARPRRLDLSTFDR